MTVAAASTLNATMADITQLTVSSAATGIFNSNSSVWRFSNLRLEAPLVRCDPTAPWLSIKGGTQGVLVNDTLLVNGGVAPEAIDLCLEHLRTTLPTPSPSRMSFDFVAGRFREGSRRATPSQL